MAAGECVHLLKYFSRGHYSWVEESFGSKKEFLAYFIQGLWVCIRCNRASYEREFFA